MIDCGQRAACDAVRAMTSDGFKRRVAPRLLRVRSVGGFHAPGGFVPVIRLRLVSCAHHRPVRLSRAKLLKRVFEIDKEHRPNCGGELKIIAAILWDEPEHKRS